MSDVPGIDRWIEGEPPDPGPAPDYPLLEPGYCWSCRAMRVLERDGYHTRICRTCGADAHARRPTTCAECGGDLPRDPHTYAEPTGSVLLCSSRCGMARRTRTEG